MTRIHTYQCENAVITSCDHIIQLAKRGAYSREELDTLIRALRAELHTLDLISDVWEIADEQNKDEEQRRLAEQEQIKQLEQKGDQA